MDETDMFATAKHLKEKYPDIPFVVLTPIFERGDKEAFAGKPFRGRLCV